MYFVRFVRFRQISSDANRCRLCLNRFESRCILTQFYLCSFLKICMWIATTAIPNSTCFTGPPVGPDWMQSHNRCCIQSRVVLVAPQWRGGNWWGQKWDGRWLRWPEMRWLIDVCSMLPSVSHWIPYVHILGITMLERFGGGRVRSVEGVVDMYSGINLTLHTIRF